MQQVVHKSQHLLHHVLGPLCSAAHGAARGSKFVMQEVLAPVLAPRQHDDNKARPVLVICFAECSHLLSSFQSDMMLPESGL